MNILINTRNHVEMRRAPFARTGRGELGLVSREFWIRSSCRCSAVDAGRAGPGLGAASVAIETLTSRLIVPSATSRELATRHRLGRLPRADVLLATYFRHLARVVVPDQPRPGLRRAEHPSGGVVNTWLTSPWSADAVREVR